MLFVIKFCGWEKISREKKEKYWFKERIMRMVF